MVRAWPGETSSGPPGAPARTGEDLLEAVSAGVDGVRLVGAGLVEDRNPESSWPWAYSSTPGAENLPSEGVERGKQRRDRVSAPEVGKCLPR